MKKLTLAAVAAMMALGIHAFADTVTSVNVVGVYDVSVGGGSNDTFSLIAVPMTKLPLARGTITANTTNTITDSSATWSNNMFAVGGGAMDEPGASTYFVEVTSGTFEGRHFYVAGNDATMLTLADGMTDVNPSDLVGAGYKVVAANRVRDVFGEPGSPLLAGGTSSSGADIIYIMSSAGWQAPIFYKNGGFGPVDVWVQSGTDASDNVIDRDIGTLILRRAGGGALGLSVTGEVSGNDQGAVIVPGFQLINGMSAVSVAIGDTTLTNVLAGGTSSSAADVVYAWSGSGWSAPVFFKNGGFGPVDTWVQSGSDVSATFMIDPGKSYLVQKKSGSPEIWGRPTPLN